MIWGLSNRRQLSIHDGLFHDYKLLTPLNIPEMSGIQHLSKTLVWLEREARLQLKISIDVSVDCRSREDEMYLRVGQLTRYLWV
jgi:hypothetical protein